MQKEDLNLNGICPYFTMFPLDFPMSILAQCSKKRQWIFDPFCGRGTTNFAARLNGFPSVGIDSSPVASSLSCAKLANTTSSAIIQEAYKILEEVSEPEHIPNSDFWELAYHEDVLKDICRLREGLLENSDSDSRIALRAVMLGALHGPINKVTPSYFSNQAPRTFSPKPAYSVKYWTKNNMRPVKHNLIDIISKRAERYYPGTLPEASGKIFKGDSSSEETLQQVNRFTNKHKIKFSTVITSPPYFGMGTYVADQWIRNWFIGGPPNVDYSHNNQLGRFCKQTFINQLCKVWVNTSQLCYPGASMVIRFGAINGQKVDPIEIISQSLEGTNWRISNILSAGFPQKGRRQSEHFVNATESVPLEEFDFYCLNN